MFTMHDTINGMAKGKALHFWMPNQWLLLTGDLFHRENPQDNVSQLYTVWSKSNVND